MRTPTDPGRARAALLLGSLASFGPVSLDLYLPALPRLTADFRIGAATAQLTLTACLVGLAVGQLVLGPLSDAYGRRRPLLAGLAVYALASAGCAAAGALGARVGGLGAASVLIGLRLVQGLAGAAGVVIARAVVRDLFDGTEMARFLSLVMLVNGVAPVLAPSLGGQLIRIVPWPGLFGVLTGWGLLLVAAVAFGLPETLPARRRDTRGLSATPAVLGQLLHDRLFLGCTLACGLNFAAMFAYIAGSPFVLQGHYQLSPQRFALAFAVNAVGILAVGQLNRPLLRRFGPRRLLPAGLCLGLAGSALLVASAVRSGGAPGGLPGVLAGLFVVVASVGMVAPNATALALAGHPGRAGSASALLGMLQFLLGAAAAPVVGLLGTAGPVPMALLMAALTLAALLAYLVLTRTVAVEPDPRPVPGPG